MRSDQLVFESRTSRSSARGNLELAVNRTHVGIGRPRTDHERICDVGGGQPLRQQAQDFDLASGEAEGIAPRGGG